MRWRVVIWLLLGTSVAVALWWCVAQQKPAPKGNALPSRLPFTISAEQSSSNALGRAGQVRRSGAGRHRLANTTKELAELTRSDSAILLENAFLDTAAALELEIPSDLRLHGSPGSYIIQSRGALNGELRQLLKNYGIQPVAYIPNNAFLVLLSDDLATKLRAD